MVTLKSSLTSDETKMNDQQLASAEYIKQQLPDINPKVGIILGSGLGRLVDYIPSKQSLSYQSIPGFPQTQVAGHSGQLHFGQLGNVEVACLQGRSHFYEGTENKTIVNLIGTLYELGCEYLLVTNAAGSLQLSMPPGALMLIQDHINFQFKNVLVGCGNQSARSPFINMEHAYCPKLRQGLTQVAASQNIPLTAGVYLGVLGPSFETPAEIRAFTLLGAHAVGMSTVAEVIAARYYGLQVAGISVITNMAAGLSQEKLSHEHTLRNAEQASSRLIQLIIAFLQQYSF